MAVDKLVDSTQLDADLTSVANAIRTKGGTSAQLAFPAGFVSAVQAIPTGTTPTGTKQISITSNGTTTEDVTNYASAEITANVPNTYAAADEGKVVSNGALVAQGSDTVTENDTYDTTLISSLTVNVSGTLSEMAHPLVHSAIRDSVPSGTRRGVVEIVRGANSTHVKMSFTSSFTGSNVCFINLTNGQSGVNGTVVNSQPLWFTIPAGKPCVFKMMNVVNNSNVQFATNFRLTNSSSSSSFGSGNDTHLSGETINATLASAEDVGCFFINFDNSTAASISGKSIEFDVSFTVDGVQYF